MDTAQRKAFTEQGRRDFAKQVEEAKKQREKNQRSFLLDSAFGAMKPALNVEYFLRFKELDPFGGIEDKYVAEYRDWQTSGLLKAGKELRASGWIERIEKLPGDSAAKDYAIDIVLAIEADDREKLRELLTDLPLLVAGNITDQVYTWLNGKLHRELRDRESPAPPAPEPVEPELSEIDRLEQTTPPLNKQSGEWVMAHEVARIEGVKQATLAGYRSRGKKTDDGLFGLDPNVRIWRKEVSKRGNPTHTVYYLKSSLELAE